MTNEGDNRFNLKIPRVPEESEHVTATTTVFLQQEQTPLTPNPEDGDMHKAVGKLLGQATEGEQQAFGVLFDILREMKNGPEVIGISAPQDHPES